MPRVRAIEVDELLGELPALTELCREAAQTWKNALFIGALGFEERCLAIPQFLERAGAHFASTCYFEYDINRPDNEINRPELERCLTALGDIQLPIAAGGPELEARLSTIHSFAKLQQPEATPLVILDISSCADWLIIRAMAALLRSEVRLIIVYSEAAMYHPTKVEYEAGVDQWSSESRNGLEWGVEEVTILSHNPGAHLDSVPDCVAIFPTFNPSRSKAIISAVDPALLSNAGDKVHWIIGLPHLVEEDGWRTGALIEINGLSGESIQHFVSTFDYKESIRALERITHQVGDRYKITVAPLGSKMQSVGTTLFSVAHPEVRIIHAVPKEYNAARYSKGCKAMWRLDLGESRQLRALLRRVGCLVVED
jgi:hypothetical protein